MKRIFVPTRSGSDWQRLLAKPKLHWKKGASAMTAAAAWEAAADRLPMEIAALLSSTQEPVLCRINLIAAIPEWKVALPGGITTSMPFAQRCKRRKLCLAFSRSPVSSIRRSIFLGVQVMRNSATYKLMVRPDLGV